MLNNIHNPTERFPEELEKIVANHTQQVEVAGTTTWINVDRVIIDVLSWACKFFCRDCHDGYIVEKRDVRWYHPYTQSECAASVLRKEYPNV